MVLFFANLPWVQLKTRKFHYITQPSHQKHTFMSREIIGAFIQSYLVFVLSSMALKEKFDIFASQLYNVGLRDVQEKFRIQQFQLRHPQSSHTYRRRCVRLIMHEISPTTLIKATLNCFSTEIFGFFANALQLSLKHLQLRRVLGQNNIKNLCFYSHFPRNLKFSDLVRVQPTQS